jgi:hypothetical protein
VKVHRTSGRVNKDQETKMISSLIKNKGIGQKSIPKQSNTQSHNIDK